MFHVLNHTELADTDEWSMSLNRNTRRHREQLDDVIRLDETMDEILDGSDDEFSNPVEDWLLD